MTTIQQIQQEIRELPEWTLDELFEYIISLKARYSKESRPEIPNARTIALLKESEEEYARGECVSFSSAQEAIEFLKHDDV